MHIIYTKICWSSKFGCHILVNNKNLSIVAMTAMRFIGPMLLVAIYLQRAAIRSMRAKFYQDCSKTERLVSVATDGQASGHTDWRTDRQAEEWTDRRADGWTNMTRSTLLVMLVQNIHTLWCRRCFLKCVTNFWSKLIDPLQVVYKDTFYWSTYPYIPYTT